MGKTTKKLLTFLLVLVMLFSASATTIFAAEEAGAGATASTGTNISAEGGASGSTGGTVNSGKYDIDWLKIEYSGNDVLVTLYPNNIDSMDEIKKITERDLVKFIVDLGTHVVFDDIKADIIGNNPPSDPVDFVEHIMNNILDIYVALEYGAADEATKHAFFDDIVKDDDAVEKFADYICTIFRAAVITEVAENYQFPTPEDYEGTVSEFFHDHITDFTGVPDSAINAALIDKFGVTLAEFEARLVEVDAIFFEKYEDAYIEIDEDNNGLDECVLLLDLLDKLEVNGLTLFGDTVNGKAFVLDTSLLLQRTFLLSPRSPR